MPEQVLKAPRSLPPIVSWKNTLLAKMLSVIRPSSVRHPFRAVPSAASVVGTARTFPAAPQFGTEQAGQRVEQAARQVVQVGAGVLRGIGRPVRALAVAL